MLRWLSDSEEQRMSEICTCRGDMEVMESQLLMSVTAISRMVGPDRDPEIQGDAEDPGPPALSAEDDGVWWI